jgi:LacI family transcriptional regulator
VTTLSAKGRVTVGTDARPTMRDVAAAAGVSIKTVSRALNDESGVQQETRARVHAAATELGFRRNDIAASLRRIGQSMATIGLLIEDVSNPFYAAVIRGVEEIARDHEYLLIAASSDEDAELERETLSAFLSRRVDGLIVVPAGGDHSYLAPDLARGTTVVFADRPARGVQADAVVVDNVRGAAEGVRHLIARGHRRIGYIGDLPGLYTARERYRGYTNALRSAKIRLDHALVRQGAHDVETAAGAAAELLALPDPPTAIFAGNNRATIGVLRQLRQHGRRIALVGFDDFELSDVLDPAVTVVACDARAVGRAAAERLFDRLAGDSGPASTIVLPTTLTARGSGELRP